ncbi:MAG: winged helix-turn-helix domain-containing protein [Burkholderia sp.]|nr:MAG: hypothetical protein E5299_00774 [Burkholderia gladioli]
MFDICKRHTHEGLAGLLDKLRVARAANPSRALSEQQEVEIRMLLHDQMPDQLKISFALWKRHAMGEWIRKRCALTLTLQGVGLYLVRWDFTPQKPMKRAYEQRLEAVQVCLNETYPEIVLQPKADSEEIQWDDETGLRSEMMALLHKASVRTQWHRRA